MFNISSFLSKFSKNINDNNLIKEEICKSILNRTNLVLKQEDITIKNNILFLDITPVYKSKIFINKKDILLDISSFKITDIK